jgi:flagellar assembly factor FliW
MRSTIGGCEPRERAMLIQTTRFGAITIDAQRIITCEEGLLGFPARRRFALIETAPDAVFFWLQSVDEPALAFVVCDPRAFFPDYQAQIRAEELRALDAAAVDECQVFVIVNKTDGHFTANLMGPLVVGARSLKARQLVLGDKRYTARHELHVPRPAAAVGKTA